MSRRGRILGSEKGSPCRKGSMAGRANSRHCSIMLSNSSSVICLLPRLSVSFGQKTHLALQKLVVSTATSRGNSAGFIGVGCWSAQMVSTGTAWQNTAQDVSTNGPVLKILRGGPRPALRPRSEFADFTPPTCLLYTSDAADEEDSVDLGGR